LTADRVPTAPPKNDRERDFDGRRRIGDEREFSLHFSIIYLFALFDVLLVRCQHAPVSIVDSREMLAGALRVEGQWPSN
jgi:hypothetical protein